MSSPTFSDPADWSRASYWPDIAAEVDAPADVLKELLAKSVARWKGDIPRTIADFRLAVNETALAAIQQAMEEGARTGLFEGVEPPMSDREMSARILSEVIHAPNPRLQAKCIDFVCGFGIIAEKTETQIGRRENVGKAAVSKRCVRLREMFKVPELRGMKSDAARESYRRRQLGKRARPAREPWRFAGVLSEAFNVAA